jgi:hypothetical protein
LPAPSQAALCRHGHHPEKGEPVFGKDHARTKNLPRQRADVMVVEKFGQLLAQAFILLALMAEYDGALEQNMLQVRWQPAPKIGGSRAKHEQITRGYIVDDLV